MQSTDSEGVSSFDTTFPGHYTGRTPHIHVTSHKDGTTFPNGTYSGGEVSHVGQLFFNQDLITEVETTSPYSTNTQDLTTNAEDSIAAGEATIEYDPFVEYVLVGDDISKGIIAWISVGINASASYNIGAAAELTADGGVAQSSSGGNGTSPGNGNGTVPDNTPGSGNSTYSASSATASTTSSAAWGNWDLKISSVSLIGMLWIGLML